MNLIEVANLFKEIVEGCSSLEGSDFYIAPPKTPHSTAEGYEIHITGKFGKDVVEYVNNIALRDNLAISRGPNAIMLYKAKPQALIK